eukprot:350747-Chlamydomonas_euryale.AAC.3
MQKRMNLTKTVRKTPITGGMEKVRTALELSVGPARTAGVTPHVLTASADDARLGPPYHAPQILLCAVVPGPGWAGQGGLAETCYCQVRRSRAI